MTGASTTLVPADTQSAASDPQLSVWVAANAGTGKTHVLIDRIVRLLLAGTPPGRILCLTFTKAAAAEMANRLYQRLGEWATKPDSELTDEIAKLTTAPVPDDVLGGARRLFARALEVPDGLKIRTIHAFCESLLARFPLEAGVAPHFSVIDERSAAEVRSDARDRMLAHAFDAGADDIAGALDHLAGIVDEAGFAQVMAELDSKRSRFTRLVAGHGGLGGLAAAIHETLGLAAGTERGQVLAEAAAPGAFDELGLNRAAAALDQGSAKDGERAAAIRRWLDDDEGRGVALLKDYGRVFLTAEGRSRAERTLITQAAQAADDGALAVLLAEQARVLAVHERVTAVSVAEATSALAAIGAALLESYERMKAGRALLDYDDLILKARDLLTADGRAAWVHYKLDGGIDHILVDEAQDTSPEQWAVIAGLADDFFTGAGARDALRTVFAVGDEKQSIYSFQGAAPEAFEGMRDHFAGLSQGVGETLRSVELARSYRSTEAVLGVVDRVFSRAFAREGLTSTAGPIHHETWRQGQGGLVELWPTVEPEKVAEADPWDAPLDQMSAASPAARLAARIAERIAEWLKTGDVLESAGRPLRPGDVMILVRTRSRFAEEMVRALKQRRIPVAGSDRMVLTEQLAVMDMMALGRFTVLPEDDLNLAVVLKGPLIGFDDDALFELAAERAGSLWRSLVERRSEDPRLEDAHRILEGLLDAADFTPPFEFFSDVLGSGRGRRDLLTRLGPDAGDPIDEFLTLALQFERDHVPSMQGFLHWVAAGETQIKRDLEHGRDEVRVMTVHGAKGLQSNVVFLPDTCTVPDPRIDPRLLWADGDAVLWAPRRADETAPCLALREDARRRIEREYRRLLYVAMTRARDRLYVCGWEGKSGRDGGCWYDLIEADVREMGEEFELPTGETAWRILGAQTAAPEEAAETGQPGGAIPGLPDWTSRPAPAEPEPPRPLAPSRPSDAEPTVTSPIGVDDGARFQRGRLIHRLLESLPEMAPGARAEAARAYLARPVHGLDGPAQGEIAAETLAVLDDPHLADLFAADSLAEVAVTGIVAGQVVSGQIDRLCVGDEAIEVIDYKSLRPPPKTEAEVPAAYLRQMAAYRGVLRQIYGDRPVRCLLLWTVGPRLMTLSDDVLDAHAP